MIRKFLLAFCLGWVALVSGCDLSPTIITDPQVTPVLKPEFRCLILEESEDRTKLPPEQLNILISGTVRDYLDANCVKGKDNQPEYRIYDKDAKLAGVWADAVKANPPSAYPWLYASNGAKGYAGPLPKTVDEFLAKIKPYAEGK
jgi:hypothetical protein